MPNWLREALRWLWRGPGLVPVRCLRCGAEMRVGAGLAGRPLTCLACGFRTQVPASAVEADPALRSAVTRHTVASGCALLTALALVCAGLSALASDSPAQRADAGDELRVALGLAVTAGAVGAILVGLLRGKRLPYPLFAMAAAVCFLATVWTGCPAWFALAGSFTPLMALAFLLARGWGSASPPAPSQPTDQERTKRMVCFHPGEIWPDEDGVHINAHGGGVLHDDGTYYWYGEFKVEGERGNQAWEGVSCYSSRDLLNWRNEGIVLPVVRDDPDHELTEGCVIERPKVIHCRATGKYVLWFHLERKGQGYAAARCGVAVSDLPTGPYEYLGSMRPDGEMSRDMTLFVDLDETAYLLCASEENATLHIHRLSSDYTTTTGAFVRAFEGRYMEAPAIFRHAGRYWFMGSGCTGWAPNMARAGVADSVMGPWTELPNPCRGPNADLTFLAQSTYILPVEGREDAFIFQADRWRPENAIDGRYVWLPIHLDADGFTITWRDEWELSLFDGPVA